MNELIYTIFISFLIASVIIIVGFGEMNKIISTNDEKQIELQLQSLNQKIKFLDEASIGSFDHIKLSVPNGFKVIISKDGIVEIISNKDVKRIKLDKEFTCLTKNSYSCENSVEYDPGVYNLLIYHGDRFESRYSICFE